MVQRTTGLQAIVNLHAGSWYLIVTATDGRASQVVPLTDGEDVVIGRAADCAIVLDDEALSRRHAVIRRRAGLVTVEDAGSRNGTTVNGAAVTAPRRVTSGDTISIGPLVVIVATATASRGPEIATLDELGRRLEAEVERALRYRRPLSLVMLALPDETGELDAVVAQLRRMDIVAEYGPRELAFVLPETARDGATLVGKRAVALLGGGRVGVAEVPGDGASAGELIANARGRMRAPRAATAQPEAGAGRVVVVDPLMKRVFELATKAAQTNINVAIVGETGTGKERVAEAIHGASRRAQGPFVRVNCAALAESLIEAELFGHEAGAFTGAANRREGLFEAAAGGTLFLDEIGELPLAIQPKLLRALETRRIVRVGGTREVEVDARFVCATHRDLDAEVARGRFREDLLFRIAAFVIPVPPLRDRRSEITPLAAQFAFDIATELGQRPVGFTPEALEALAHGAWPGNLRELRNVIERAFVLAEGSRIDCTHLPEHLVRPEDAGAPEIRRRVADVERDLVVAALEGAGGNQTLAAKRLGISRFALGRLLVKHGVKRQSQ